MAVAIAKAKAATPEAMERGVKSNIDDMYDRVEKVAFNGKTRDEASAAILHIPITRDLDSVGLLHDRIENRLLGQTRRKCPIAGRLNQRQFLGADRPV